jgi:hypothetical protein
MTGLDLATSLTKGGLSLVLLAAPGHAQTWKEAKMTHVAAELRAAFRSLR